jgi:dienelactone hydrolase
MTSHSTYIRTKFGKPADRIMQARALLPALSIILGLSISLQAQQSVTAPRADGRSTGLMIYKADNTSAACPPLAIISHGVGGSENNYVYLARAIAEGGYTAIVMGHAESGYEALRSSVLSLGIRDGVEALVKNKQAESARLLDVSAALAWANARCQAPFKVLLGHSMGSSTVMLEAGARNVIDVSSPPAGQNRFDAYVALSPEGPGIAFPDHAWSDIHESMLIMTGTRDQSLKGGPKARQIPWHELPGDGARGCQWMGVIKSATHLDFAGSGPGANKVEPLVTSTTLAFLGGVRAGHCTRPAAQVGLTISIK